MDYLSMLKQLLRYAKGERWKIAIYYVFHFISILGVLCQPYAFAMVINVLQENQRDVIHQVVYWLGVYVLGFIVFNIFHRSARFIERYVAFRAKKSFYLSIYDVLQSLPLSWHEENHTGNVIDRVNQAANSIYYFGQSQASIIEMVIKFFGSIIILSLISPVIAIVALVVGFGVVFITKTLYKFSVPEYRQQNEKFHKVSAAIYDYIKNITTIIVLKLGKYVQKDLGNRVDEIFPHVVKENRITQLKCFLNDLLVICLNVGLIFYYICSRSLDGEIIMVGSIAAIFQYLGVFMSAVDFYASDYENIIHWNTSFKAVEPILNANPLKRDESVRTVREWNMIKFGPINFSYGKGKAELVNANVCLQRGKKIAFIGESGAGKSTLLRIMSGLIRIAEDNVLVDGKSEGIDSLEEITSYIPQEPEIFENTINYNITMGIPARQEEIETCAKIACFNDVVDKLDMGYESDIRENGVNLSGGEKQRLALARGIFAVKDSSIVLLDEPTGSLDPSTEMQVYTQIFQEMQDKCIVSVLHRLHLLYLFDYIYVFKNGTIVQEGTFEELQRVDGEFIRLWNEYQVEEKKADNN